MTAARETRNREIVALRRKGVSLAAIGARYGITHERVRQVLAHAGAGGTRCLDCGTPTSGRRMYCEEHGRARAQASGRRQRERASGRSANRYRERRADGLCWACGAPSGERSRCEKCASAHAQYAAAVRVWRRRAGLCIRCGRQAAEGRAHCPGCAARMREYSRRSREQASGEVERPC